MLNFSRLFTLYCGFLWGFDKPMMYSMCLTNHHFAQKLSCVQGWHSQSLHKHAESMVCHSLATVPPQIPANLRECGYVHTTLERRKLLLHSIFSWALQWIITWIFWYRSQTQGSPWNTLAQPGVKPSSFW